MVIRNALNFVFLVDLFVYGGRIFVGKKHRERQRERDSVHFLLWVSIDRQSTRRSIEHVRKKICYLNSPQNTLSWLFTIPKPLPLLPSIQSDIATSIKPACLWKNWMLFELLCKVIMYIHRWIMNYLLWSYQLWIHINASCLPFHVWNIYYRPLDLYVVFNRIS